MVVTPTTPTASPTTTRKASTCKALRSSLCGCAAAVSAASWLMLASAVLSKAMLTRVSRRAVWGLLVRGSSPVWCGVPRCVDERQQLVVAGWRRDRCGAQAEQQGAEVALGLRRQQWCEERVSVGQAHRVERWHHAASWTTRASAKRLGRGQRTAQLVFKALSMAC